MADGAGRDDATIVTMPAETERQFTDHVGMIVFLASWAMMFGALFFLLVGLRLRAPAWPPPGPRLPVLLPAIATAVLVASELVLLRVMAALRRREGRRIVSGLAALLALGFLFLGLQGATWASVWKAGLRHDSGPYGSLFYALTIFHALHVVVGLGLLAGRLPAASRHEYDVRHAARFRLAGMFWHFVGIVWILTFLSMYIA